MTAEKNKHDPGPNPRPNPPFTKQTEQTTETGVSSVSLVKNSKGVNIGVKVYNENPTEAKDRAETLFDALSKKYSDNVQN